MYINHAHKVVYVKSFSTNNIIRDAMLLAKNLGYSVTYLI